MTERFGEEAIEIARLERTSQPRGRHATSYGDSDLTRASSAPQLPPGAGTRRTASLAALGGAMPKPIFDAWQRGEGLPGMPPLLPKLSPEKLHQLEERRRKKAKEKVEEWRQACREQGEKWLVGRQWYVTGDRPSKSYRLLNTIGPGYAPGNSPRLGSRGSYAQLMTPSASTASLSAGHFPAAEPLEGDDVAGTGEEKFEDGMRNNALERDAADANNDGKLDFDEFCALIRDREKGEHKEADLRKRFNALDEDGSGEVDKAEYLQWSLKDSLARSSDRVVDLFRAWDVDRSGSIDKREFRKAIKAMGFEIDQANCDKVFDSLDADKSGSLEYKELNTMLRKGLSAEAALARLKRGPKQADRSRAAKLTNKNVNVNYVAQRTSVLPTMIKLSARTGVSVQEQLRKILHENSVRLIDLFREWDDDGNGALDKVEFRQAVAALGYDAPKAAVDALFDSMDDDRGGFIEFHELKYALSEKGAKRATKELQTYSGKGVSRGYKDKAEGEAEGEGDVAGTGEEDFETGMRQNAMERDAADADNDGKLDFDEFCVFVRDREEGEITDKELRERFEALDGDKSGQIDMSEYLIWSLKDALARSGDRVVDLFRAWDEDKSGTIDKKEFFKAVRALGFDVEEKDANLVFDALDADKSGSLEYKELNTMLRQGVGSDLTKRNLKRAPKQADRGRMAKLTAKNVNVNYVTSRSAALPPTVKLEKGNKTIQEQLFNAVKEHKVRLIDLFREWDDDGNGALDKKELRRAVAALGYDAPKKEIDDFFDSMDDDGSGLIEFDELKAALSEKGVKAAQKALADKKKKEAKEKSRADNTGVEGDDKVGRGEEDFEAGMRQNAMERDAADADNDGKLDFDEFCVFVRDREEGEITDKELRERFEALDGDKSGQIDMSEYLIWSLKDALARSGDRVVDLFRAWDEDKSGTIDKKEFFKAVRALGFDVEEKDANLVFDALDADKSGSLEYKELNTMLRQGVGSDLTKRNLKRAPKQADRGRMAKLTAKNVNVNYVTSRSAALPPTVKLEKGNKTIQEQLFNAVKEHKVRLIDLFREWDDDGNGALDKKELRRAVAALGYDAPKKEIDDFFDSMDDDGSGLIEFDELKAALSEKGVKAAQKALADKKKKEAKEKSRADNTGVEGDDKVGRGEEDFEAGMRQNAMERDAADADNDGKLDFDEFCVFVRDREEGEITDKELRERFEALDGDKSGQIDMSEYLIWSLKDALARSGDRVVDLFRAWDEDKSGTIDKKEFFKAVRALGFDVEEKDANLVFDALDADKSGSLEYKELNTMLRQGVGSDLTKRNLKRAPKQADRGRMAKLTAKNVNVNYVTSRSAALPPTVKLEKGNKTIQEQLFNAVKEHKVRLIDLFREWDDDGNGALDKKELRRAVAALGYDAPKKEIDDFFDSMDDDGSGLIEFDELKAALSEKGVKAAQKALADKKKKEAKEKSRADNTGVEGDDRAAETPAAAAYVSAAVAEASTAAAEAPAATAEAPVAAVEAPAAPAEEPAAPAEAPSAAAEAPVSAAGAPAAAAEAPADAAEAPADAADAPAAAPAAPTAAAEAPAAAAEAPADAAEAPAAPADVPTDAAEAPADAAEAPADAAEAPAAPADAPAAAAEAPEAAAAAPTDAAEAPAAAADTPANAADVPTDAVEAPADAADAPAAAPAAPTAAAEAPAAAAEAPADAAEAPAAPADVPTDAAEAPADAAEAPADAAEAPAAPADAPAAAAEAPAAAAAAPADAADAPAAPAEAPAAAADVPTDAAEAPAVDAAEAPAAAAEAPAAPADVTAAAAEAPADAAEAPAAPADVPAAPAEAPAAAAAAPEAAPPAE